MNSIQIQCFLKIAENLSFSRAADILFVSQPTVSHHIQKLESEIGVTLFERDKKTVRLTPAGETFYRSMKQVANDLDKAVLNARQYATHYQETIRVGCELPGLEYYYVANAILELQKKFPRTRFEFITGDPRDNLTLFLQRKLDVLFTTRELLDGLSDVEFEKLYRADMVCVVHKDNPLYDREYIDIADLEGQNFLFLDPAQSPPEMVTAQKQMETMYPYAAIQYTMGYDVSMMLARANQGIAFMPMFHFREDEGIRGIPFRNCKAVTCGIARHAGGDTPVQKAFCKMVVKAFQTWNDLGRPSRVF